MGPVERAEGVGREGRQFPVYSGVLATAGDVVFYGTMDGWFKAIDARTGASCGSSRRGSGIVGNPMTYIGPDGKQYIAVYSGIGGWMGAVAFPRLTDDPYAALGVIGAMKDIKNYSAPGGSALCLRAPVAHYWRSSSSPWALRRSIGITGSHRTPVRAGSSPPRRRRIRRNRGRSSSFRSPRVRLAPSPARWVLPRLSSRTRMPTSRRH